MPHSYVVYIDESGDEGFQFQKGSSEWFVLSAVVTRTHSDLDTVRVIDRVRESLGKEPKQTLHFRKLKHEHRVPYVHLIATTAYLRALTVAIHKPSIREPETFQQRYLLYRYATRLLLERVSWLCRDRRINRPGEDGSARIIFSNRSGMSYDEIREYITLLKGKQDVRIVWDVIKPEQVQAINHDKLMGLQLADAIASSFFYGLQKSQFGFTEPQYSTILRPIMYYHKGQYRGYGLKIWPSEDVLTRPELAWVLATYAS